MYVCGNTHTHTYTHTLYLHHWILTLPRAQRSVFLKHLAWCFNTMFTSFIFNVISDMIGLNLCCYCFLFVPSVVFSFFPSFLAFFWINGTYIFKNILTYSAIVILSFLFFKLVALGFTKWISTYPSFFSNKNITFYA